MVSITEDAAAKLKKIMEKKEKSDCGLRIFVADVDCCGPEFGIGLEEKPQESDTVFESHGIKIFIGEDLAKVLDGSVIDYTETPYGSGFVINSSSASSCCSSSRSCD